MGTEQTTKNFIPPYKRYLKSGLSTTQIDKLFVQIVAAKIPGLNLPWIGLAMLALKIAALFWLWKMRSERIDKEILVEQQLYIQDMLHDRRKEVDD